MVDNERLEAHMNNGEVEYIMCSENHIDDGKDYTHKPFNIDKGIVFCGLRHCVCFEISHLSHPHDEYGNCTTQGFLTNKNRFVNRSEAFIIAIDSGQLKTELKSGKLYSEDLW